MESRIVPATVDLSITGTAGLSFLTEHTPIEYTVTVRNAGPDTATGVGVSDTVPTYYGTPTNISDGGTVFNGNDVQWTGLTIPAGGSIHLTYQVAAAVPGGFIAPTAANGAWDRPTASNPNPNATFQGWEIFSSPNGPNAPQTVPIVPPTEYDGSFGGGLGVTWAPINPGGTANAYDTSGNSFITGGGNIYSFSAPITPRIVVPNNIDGVAGDNAHGYTTILLQVKVIGETLNPDTVVLNGVTKPTEYALISRTTTAAGFGGLDDTWAFEFRVPGNADVYTIDFAAAGSSMSLDWISVDTVWNPAALADCDAFSGGAPFKLVNFAQVTAADQVDVDSAPNNGTSLSPTQDDEAATVFRFGNTPPRITSNGGGSSAVLTADENTTAVITAVTVADPQVPGQILTYSLDGPDSALFQISPDGKLRFITAPDFETPTDADTNGVYQVTVTVRDNGVPVAPGNDPLAPGIADSQALSITVVDKAEGLIDLSLNKTVSNAGPSQGSTITYTLTLSNSGPDTATGVGISDLVPDVFGTPTAISNGGTVPGGSNDVQWSGLTIPSGGSLSLTYQVVVGAAGSFIAPTTTMGELAWNRPTAANPVQFATFQAWETFATPGGPNAPQNLSGPAFGGPSGAAWTTVNPAGTPNAFDSNSPASGSIITGGGNIYSFAGVVKPRVIVPNNFDGVSGTNPRGWTTLLFQIRSSGTPINPSTVLLNGSLAPTDFALLAKEDLGAQGFRETWLFQFQVPGNADSYQLDVSAAGSSLSLDRLAVDTIWIPCATSQSAAYSIPLPVSFGTYAQVIAADQADVDSSSNNGGNPNLAEDDEATINVSVPPMLNHTAPPTITSISPVAGPTTGGTLVVITGTGFDGATSVTFGGTNAASFLVNSGTQITATAPAHLAGAAEVVVTTPAGSNDTTLTSNDFTYIAAAAPQFSDMILNGGEMYTVNSYGEKPTGLAGNNSVVGQLYVTFDIGVTLGAGAFTLDAGTTNVDIPTVGGVSPVPAGANVVTLIVEPDAATLDANGGYKGYRLRFSGSGNYLNTLDNGPTGAGGVGNISTTLKDGFYKLNINGANIHAGNSLAGTPMAGNVIEGFWVMYGGADPSDRDVAGEGHPGTPGDGSSIISVNASLVGFSQTNGRGYGTDLAGYNANYDFNLDGDIGDDLIEFAKRFGSQWSF